MHVRYVTELLNSHQQQSHDLRAQQGLALPPLALLTVLVKLVLQNLTGASGLRGIEGRQYTGLSRDHLAMMVKMQ